MCVYVVCITYFRILVLQINRVSFYKELSLECDFKYFHPYAIEARFNRYTDVVIAGRALKV